MTLIEKLVVAKKQLKPFQTDYRVVFEDDMDSPAKVMIPDPNFMAAAMAGGVLPPVEVFHQLKIDDEGRVLNGHVLHVEPVGPMTEEEAIEYLIQKDIPAHVWSGTQDNRIKFMVVRKEQLPQSRQFRNAWRLADAQIAA